jgi:hypothetical protein
MCDGIDENEKTRREISGSRTLELLGFPSRIPSFPTASTVAVATRLLGSEGFRAALDGPIVAGLAVASRWRASTVRLCAEIVGEILSYVGRDKSLPPQDRRFAQDDNSGREFRLNHFAA